MPYMFWAYRAIIRGLCVKEDNDYYNVNNIYLYNWDYRPQNSLHSQL
jgi:hypothetical protein